TAPSDWRYRTEGGAHLIFTYAGSSPSFSGRVLRIRKPTSPMDAHEAAGILWKEKLLPKLISSSLLLGSKAVDLDTEWVKTLLGEAEGARPRSRRQGAGSLSDAITGPVKASIMDDTTAVGNSDTETILSIEIKPKWGFLPRAEFVTPPEAVSIKSQIPRYVLHRHYKNEPIEDAYNPQDLFSGEEERVKKASEDLWRIWETSDGMKNNWRIYVNGQVIKPGQADRIPLARDSTDAATRTLPLVIPQLLSSGVFAELKQLQSTLDPIDISTLATRFQHAYPKDALFDPALITEPDSTELEEFVEKYLENPSRGVEKAGWTLREHMIAYALSAIFKDCSIFVSIPLVKVGDEWTVKPGTKVKIIDLDLKDVKNLGKWHDLDRAIWQHWLE
ncbi:inositol-pentakisphosphate 2-kinase, partial [Papiliotrema laurentii]